MSCLGVLEYGKTSFIIFGQAPDLTVFIVWMEGVTATYMLK